MKTAIMPAMSNAVLQLHALDAKHRWERIRTSLPQPVTSGIKLTFFAGPSTPT